MYPLNNFSHGAARTVFCPKYLYRQTCANSEDLDQTPPNLGLHCLHLTKQFLDTATGSQMGLLKRQD